MKFSWKLCVSVLALSMAVTGIGGYALLSALFQSAYRREIKSAAEENRMLQYSFAAYWSTALREGSSGFPETDVRRTAQAMQEGMAGTELRFQLYNREGKELYDSGAAELLGQGQREQLFLAASEETRSRMLVETEDGYGLATVSTLLLEDGTLVYLETDRDVTALFTERREQYSIYRWWMAGLVLLQGLGSYLLAAWLLRPLGRLSRAAQRIAGGNLKGRARVETGDEIGQLAVDFNHMADNLEQQFWKLEDAARRQEDFIGSFAHELKTPLTSMIGYADMLRSREMGQEERFEAANYIFKEGKRLEALSFKLLDLLVIRHGELTKRPADVRWLAQELGGVLEPVLQGTAIRFQALVEEGQVPMEPDLIKTVLLNLLDNGRKAMEGGGTLQLLGRFEQEKGREGFAFYVKDTGKGMPKEELSRITEAFYMVDKSRARRQGGAGLGLALCAEIVKRHRGRLSFQSVEGRGTLARVWLPAEEEKSCPGGPEHGTRRGKEKDGEV